MDFDALIQLRASVPEFNQAGTARPPKPCCCRHVATEFLGQKAVPVRRFNEYIVFRAITKTGRILDMCFDRPAEDIHDGFTVDEDVITEMNYWIDKIETYRADGTLEYAVKLNEDFPIECDR